jgi:hypothetical protein
MAKIVQTLTRPSKEYRQDVADSQVRDLDAVIQKLNTTFQQELKDEVEAQHDVIYNTVCKCCFS